MNRLNERFPLSHPDIRGLSPSKIPLLIVGTKYDIFAELESMKRKLLLQALRYISHVYGASLVCVSQKDKASLGIFRMMLNSMTSGTPLKKVTQYDGSKPLCILAGKCFFAIFVIL
jgi:dynein light intermediate chain 2